MPTTANQMPDMPATLVRTPEKQAAVTEAAKAIAAKHNASKPAPAAPAKAKPSKAQRMAKVVSGEPKPAKATKAKPAASAKPTHRPSTIARTDDNPAKSIVPERFKSLYKAHNDTNGTKLALALKTATTTRNADGREVLDVPALKAIAKANGVDFARYEHLNNGQKRMNVGNKLAGLLKAGKKVVVGKQVFADAGKALAKPVAEEHAAA